MFIAKKNNAPADAATLLNSRRVPARLHSSEVAGMLGFQDHDIPVLLVARLLIPLGKPAANAPKYAETRASWQAVIDDLATMLEHLGYVAGRPADQRRHCQRCGDTPPQ